MLALGVAAGAAALVLGPTSEVAASDGELAINELAEEISTSADDALLALDRYEASGDVADERSLSWYRAMTARYTARQIGYDELAMIDAWSRIDLDRQRAVLAALSQVGVPYRTNTSIEDEGFDCSGLTTYAWASSEVELPRNSTAQIRAIDDRARDTALAGDLVQYPGHIMMYLGVDDAIVHSIQTGRTVEVDTISQRRRDSVAWGSPLG